MSKVTAQGRYDASPGTLPSGGQDAIGLTSKSAVRVAVETAAGTAVSPMTQAEFIAALKSGTATHSTVNSGATSVTILASNADRKGARIRNSDANALHLDLTGGTATADRAQVTLAQNESHAVDAGYTGAITGIWAADGSGVASVAEFTA